MPLGLDRVGRDSCLGSNEGSADGVDECMMMDRR